MKVDKKIKAMPWPEPYKSRVERVNFRVSVATPVVDGHRLLVVTVCRNREHHIYPWRSAPVGDDFRLVCCKAKGAEDVAYITQTGRAAARKSLDDGIRGWDSTAYSCYPDISQKDEDALCLWLGIEPNQRGKGTYNHALDRLNGWTLEAIAHAKQREAVGRGELLDEDVDLCPEELPAGLVDYIHRVMLPEDNILLYKRGNVRGTCYLCGREVKATGGNKFRQGSFATCPDCGGRIYCVLEGGENFRSKNLEDVATIQLGTDGATLFIRQWRLLRKSPEELREDTAGCLKEVARYAVRGNKVAKWKREAKEGYYMQKHRYDLDRWERMKNVSEVYAGSYYFYIPENWGEILASTSLKYIDMAGYDAKRPGEEHRDRNMIRFLLDWARYPTVELLWKAGYTKLVDEKVTGGLTKENRNTVRWSAPSLQRALPVPLRLLKAKKPGDWMMRDVKKLADLWTWVERGRIKERDIPDLIRHRVQIEDIEIALPCATVRQIVKYLTRQREVCNDYHVGMTYRDYLGECLQLGLDLGDKQVLFPPNLDAAHDRTMTMVKYEKSKEKEAAYQKAVKKLEGKAWAKDGLRIRPAATVRELIEEGEALHHCVGGYADRVARGFTAIFLVRREEEPDKPYYTLELRDKQVVQCRTDHNQSYESDERVRAFVEEWLANVVRKTAKKKKTARGAKAA